MSAWPSSSGLRGSRSWFRMLTLLRASIPTTQARLTRPSLLVRSVLSYFGLGFPVLFYYGAEMIARRHRRRRRGVWPALASIGLALGCAFNPPPI